MGIYYKAVNITKKQVLEPHSVAPGWVKRGAICNGDFSRLLAFLMSEQWQGDHVVIVNDAGTSELYFEADGEESESGYAEITEDAIRWFNDYFEPYKDPADAIAFKDRIGRASS